MCNLTEKLFDAICAKYLNDRRLRKPFNVNIRKNNGIIIGSTNIDIQEGLNKFFAELTDFISSAITNNVPKGEIQSADIKHGRNVDMGIDQAEIINGRFFEIYCYNCFSITFVRVWLEKALFIEKKWISIDIDEIQHTPWFKGDDDE
jgi:hypothetical protein